MTRAIAVGLAVFLSLPAAMPAVARAASVDRVIVDHLRSGKPVPRPPDARDTAPPRSYRLTAEARGAGPVVSVPALPATIPAGPATEDAAEPGSAADQGAKATDIRVRLTGDPVILLHGYRDRRRLHVPIPDAADLAAATLTVSFRNGADVLADQSRLRVQVNDRPIATFNLASTSGYTEVRIALPPLLLRTGRNTVVFEVFQVHRVLCSIDGSYELWTRLDGAETALSLRYHRVPALREATIRSWLELAAANGEPFVIMAPAAAGRADGINVALMLAQGFGLRTGRDSPRFDWTAPPLPSVAPSDAGPLRTLDPATLPRAGRVFALVGTRDQLRPWLSSDFYHSVQGARVEWVDLTGRAGGLLLVLTGRSTQETLSAARAFAQAAVDETALRPVVTVRGSQSFADVPIPAWQTELLRDRLDVRVRLPATAFAATDAPVVFHFVGRYASRLGPNSDLLVWVNDRPSGLLRLSDPEGDVLDDDTVVIPLRRFRPGANRITLEARLPLRPDDPCPPAGGTDAGSPTPRLVLAHGGRIDWPTVANLAALPSLASLAAAGFPYGHGDGVVDVLVPRGDRLSISAALAIVARIANVAGRPFDAAVRFDPAAAIGHDALVVAGIEDFDRPLFGVDPIVVEELRRFVFRSVVTVEGTRTADIDPRRLSGLVESVRRRAEHGRFLNAPLISALYQSDRQALPGGSLKEEVGMLGRLEEWMHRFRGRLEERLVGTAADAQWRSWLDAYHGPFEGMVLQFENPRRRGGTWTVFLAADQVRLYDGVGHLVRPEIWHTLAGQAAIYGQAPAATDRFTATNFYYQPGSIRNVTSLLLVAGTWGSNNVPAFLAILGLLILGFAMMAVRVLASNRRHEGVR